VEAGAEHFDAQWEASYTTFYSAGHALEGHRRRNFAVHGGGLISLASLPSLCYGTDSVTTEIEGNAYTSYGFYIFPC